MYHAAIRTFQRNNLNFLLFNAILDMLDAIVTVQHNTTQFSSAVRVQEFLKRPGWGGGGSKNF